MVMPGAVTPGVYLMLFIVLFFECITNSFKHSLQAQQIWTKIVCFSFKKFTVTYETRLNLSEVP